MNELVLKNENNPTVGGESYRSIIARNCNNLIIDDCMINGGNKYKTQRAIYLRNCVDAIITLNETFNTGAGLMAIDCPGLQVVGNAFRDMSEGTGIRVQAGNLDPQGMPETIIDGNTIHGQHLDPNDDGYRTGVNYHPGSGIGIRISNVTVRNNIVHDGFAQGIMFYRDEPGLKPYKNMAIENNLFYDTGPNRLRNVGGAMVVKGNTFVGYIDLLRANSYWDLIQRYSGQPLGVSLAAGFDGRGVVVSKNIVVGPWRMEETGAVVIDNVFWYCLNGKLLQGNTVCMVHGDANPSLFENIDDIDDYQQLFFNHGYLTHTQTKNPDYIKDKGRDDLDYRIHPDHPLHNTAVGWPSPDEIVTTPAEPPVPVPEPEPEPTPDPAECELDCPRCGYTMGIFAE